MDSKVGPLKPRPLREVVHGTEVGGVMLLGSPLIGSGEPLGNSGIGGAARKYLLTLAQNVTTYTWLEPAAVCTVAVMEETLLRWCAAMGVPKV